MMHDAFDLGTLLFISKLVCSLLDTPWLSVPSLGRSKGCGVS